MPKTDSPSTFRSSGFTFRLLQRIEQIAMYEKTKPTYHAGYEVVVLSSPKKPFLRAGVLITPKSETMPSSREWGKNGFSYRVDELDKAFERFEILLARERRRARAKPKSE